MGNRVLSKVKWGRLFFHTYKRILQFKLFLCTIIFLFKVMLVLKIDIFRYLSSYGVLENEYGAPSTLNSINTRPICSVWSKTGTFQRSLVHMKSASITLPTLCVFTTIGSFKMRYCMNFYLKGHQKYEKSNFWLSRFT